MRKKYKISLLGKLKEWISFKRKNFNTEILYENNFLEIYNNNFKYKILYSRIKNVKIYFDKKIEIITNNNEHLVLKYIHKNELILIEKDILSYYQKYIKNKYEESLEIERKKRETSLEIAKQRAEEDEKLAIIELFNDKAHRIDELYNAIQSFLAQNTYLSGSMISQFVEDKKPEIRELSKLKSHYKPEILDQVIVKKFEYLINLSKNFNNKIVADLRIRFIKFIMEEEKEFFAKLKTQQKVACIVNNDTNLVIAGAGSGKTLVMLTRAAYLIKRKIAHSDEIIILAYNKKAQQELKDRAKNILHIKNYGNDKSHNIATFHSLGKKIIQHVEGIKYKEVISKDEQKELIEKVVLDLINEDQKYLKLILEYFNFYFYPYPNNNVKSINEYAQYMKSKNIKSANPSDEVPFGTYDECIIANFLYFHNIDYCTNEAIGDKYKGIKASFYLRNYDTYIFYKPNSFGARFEKNDSLRHTILKDIKYFEISYEDCKNPLEIEHLLENKLQNFGVKVQHLNANEIFEKIKKSKLINEFISILHKFLSLYKNSEEGKLDFLENKYTLLETFSANRIIFFIHIFRMVFKYYTDELNRDKKIDFDDMIYLSNKYIKEGKYKSPYKYIMIDEFQDISYARAELIKSLLAQKRDSNLFCVGDDWQAIYRFSGCELKFVTEFKKEFANDQGLNCSETLLDYTFRFNDKIQHTSSTFVTENKKQKEKKIKTIHFSNRPKVNIVLKGSQYTEDILFKILTKISKRKDTNEETTVLILSRYNYYKNLKESKTEIDNYFKQDISKKFGIKISFSSIHAAKGAEADYVVLIDVKSGFKAFPSERESDEIIEMMLPKEENSISHAEERRLMYVALTRAKKEMWIEADINDLSPFIEELKQDKFKTRVLNLTNFQDKYGILKKKVKCPVCKIGNIIERTNTNGEIFYACNNYPTCTYTLKYCLACNSNSSLFRESETRYHCFNCNKKFKVCTKCDDGIRTKYIFYQNGKKTGEQIYCSNYATYACSPHDKDASSHINDIDVSFPVFEKNK
jgi:DNA helicase IV